MIEVKPFFVYTPLGVAEVRFVIHRNAEERTCLFGVFQKETKEFWLWPNSQIRICESVSAMRDGNHSEIFLSVEQIGDLTPHIKRHRHSPFYWRVGEQKIFVKAKFDDGEWEICPQCRNWISCNPGVKHKCKET